VLYSGIRFTRRVYDGLLQVAFIVVGYRVGL